MKDLSLYFDFACCRALLIQQRIWCLWLAQEHEQKGMTGAVGGVLRQVPPTVIQPVLIATEATSNILGGMRNQLLPDKKREDEDKWKPDED